VCLTALIGSVAIASSAHSSRTQSAARVETFTLQSQVFKNARTIRVLLPPGYDGAGGRYPVLYLNDGYEVFAYWDLPSVVTPLIQQKRIVPLIVVGIDHAAERERPDEDLSARSNEYLPYPAAIDPTAQHPQGKHYPKFLLHEVMPAVAQRFRTRAGANNLAIGGASLGALAALYTVVKEPMAFGKLLLESGGTPPPGSPMLSDLQRARKLPATIWLALGTNETADSEANRQFVDNARNIDALMRRVSPRSCIRFAIEEGAHHESAAWSRRLPDALVFLFGTSRVGDSLKAIK